MSGSGRKSKYRKAVTTQVLHGNPEPQENEEIVQVIALRGSNLFEVKHSNDTISVAMLPTKFRKLIWVKRGDYLIVSSGDGGDITTSIGKKGAVTLIVVHILYKDQIKHLKSKGLWPETFYTESDTINSNDILDQDIDGESNVTNQMSKNGIQMVETDMYFINRNRKNHDIESEEEEDEEDDN